MRGRAREGEGLLCDNTQGVALGCCWVAPLGLQNAAIRAMKMKLVSCLGLALDRPLGAEVGFRRPGRDAVEIGVRVPGTSSLANIRCRSATAEQSV